MKGTQANNELDQASDTQVGPTAVHSGVDISAWIFPFIDFLRYMNSMCTVHLLCNYSLLLLTNHLESLGLRTCSPWQCSNSLVCL